MAFLLSGGNWRDFTYIMRWGISHLHNIFHHKIVGDLMRFWVNYFYEFWLAIFNCLTNNAYLWETIAHPDMYKDTDLVFDTFCIFGFIDNFVVPDLHPGDAPTQRLGFSTTSRWRTTQDTSRNTAWKHKLCYYQIVWIEAFILIHWHITTG